MPHVGEKATTVREPGNKHDQFAVAVLEWNIVHSWTLAAGNIQDSFYRRFLIMHHISNVAL